MLIEGGGGGSSGLTTLPLFTTCNFDFLAKSCCPSLVLLKTNYLSHLDIEILVLPLEDVWFYPLCIQLCHLGMRNMISSSLPGG